ncbi:hypothetical protein [Apilactobacillus micheneri]|uniref:Uncharacterized protein n=1 Tax=Apilactobacillus micheneri TaxID=1899430 RepID=A0A9Q8MTR9_9LACO|nr:hypothetical protein [Apilactobacillus micheneri]TPR39979.1 hypothetical protein DY121_03860 [Apilactobacillus micheneri]TPR44181.1 hypothetical protein DY130_03855 [Apilactobacillus micheneri]TPR45805.1 hypothetical protein DY128_03855 [Apilactobacillus micheneri]TPR50549.1 hypothetical protein DY037_00970 [Apilactobacillus micheneri]TPR51567.1 hypothetical protein DY126_03915 [Apilactobacillus micheneri]
MSERKFKNKNMYFHRIDISEKQGKDINLSEKFNEIFENFKNKNFQNIEELNINGERIFINLIRKDMSLENSDYPVFVINTATVNKNTEIELGDLNKEVDERKEILQRNDNTGILNNTQYVIDPQRKIICSCRGINRNTQYYTIEF